MLRLRNKLPWYGYTGILLVIITWYLNWHLSGLRTHILFFPLWLGYCLTIDSITYSLTGSSLIKRSIYKYISLYFYSVPVWWLFEILNLRTRNWEYLARSQFSDLEYFLYASLCFSTVIPAVFGTAELFASFKWIRKLGKGPKISSSRGSLNFLFFLGVLFLVLLLAWPQYCYIFVWLSVFLILDVINAKKNRVSLLYFTNIKDWRPLVTLALGCLMCGFFWEMWNFYAYPKWIYHTPGVEFLYVFEMPLLGYLGYIPFSFELFAFYSLVAGIRIGGDNSYLKLYSYS